MFFILSFVIMTFSMRSDKDERSPPIMLIRMQALVGILRKFSLFMNKKKYKKNKRLKLENLIFHYYQRNIMEIVHCI